MSDIEIWKRKLQREKKARIEAEKLLEGKALELYRANQKLRHLNLSLENTVEERTLKLQAEEQRSKALIESVNDIIFKTDHQGNFIFINPVTIKITGYSEKELIGKHFSDLIASSYRKNAVEFFKLQFENLKAHSYYEFPIITKEGKEIWLGQNAQLLFEGKRIKEIIAVARNITERKKTEQELIKAKRIAENAEAAQKQFLANMSHEIRTPLNAVIGITHLLYNTDPSKKQLEYLESIKYSADLLLGVITDVLDLSKIEEGEVEFSKEKFNLGYLMQTITKTFEYELAKKEISICIQLDKSIPENIIGDKTALNQILVNLIGNAAKFTNMGSIIIDVKSQKRLKKSVKLEFTITDTGIGIPSEQLKTVFNKFKQGSNEISTKYGGSGLGLAITKKLIELQGGKIAVKSKQNIGTTFMFQLDYDTEENNAKEPAVEQPTSPFRQKLPEDCKVLVVEDNLINQQYISDLLKKWKIEYALAPNGKEALKFTSKNKYDVILMDIRMPVLNGYETTKQIRNNVKNPNQNTPIVGITASALVKDKKESLRIGMNAHLTKPFTPKKLNDALMQYITLEPLESYTASLQNKSRLNNCIIEYDILNELYQDDTKHMKHMFHSFLKNTPSALKDLNNFYKKKNYNQLYELAHKIKPTFKMVGLIKIERIVDQIESICKSKKGLSKLAYLINELNELNKTGSAEVEIELKKIN